MDGLTGLSGLQQLTEDQPEATPEEIHGDIADPVHGQTGETAQPYSWLSLQTPSGSYVAPTDSSDLADDLNIYCLSAGTLAEDPTSERMPWTHAAPWPDDPIGDGSVSPDNTVRQIMQNAAIRSFRVGGLRNVFWETGTPQNAKWQDYWFVDPNGTDLTDVPDQMKSGAAPGGRGHTDRTQSNAHQNRFGFDARHMHRRWSTDPVPGNYMWMKPGGRPLVKSLAGPARPAIGYGSPFEGDNLGTAFGIDGAILANVPSEYQAPPVPYVAPESAAVDNGAPLDLVDWYGV
jgi:hypothetical protein